MESEIRFLHTLEGDLEKAASAATRRASAARSGARRGGGSRRWLAAVAAVFVLAWGIGFVVQNPPSQFGPAGPVRDAGGVQATSGGAAEDAPEAAVPAPWSSIGDRDALGSEMDSFEADKQVQGAALDESGAQYDAGAEQAADGEAAFGQAEIGELEDLAKIIRDGRMRVKVADGTFRDARDEAVAIAEAAGGFVLDSRVEGRSGTFTLRIPAARFDSVMSRLGRLGEVELEEQNGEDVTAEYIDLEARLDILTARRDVIQELMEEATTLNQTLQLQSKFDEVQLQLERMAGQLRFLDDQIAEATIQLQIIERTAPEAQIDDVDNPSLLTAWERGIQGFLNVIAVAIVGLGYLLPLLVVAGVWFGIRELMKRRTRA